MRLLFRLLLSGCLSTGNRFFFFLALQFGSRCLSFPRQLCGFCFLLCYSNRLAWCFGCCFRRYFCRLPGCLRLLLGTLGIEAEVANSESDREPRDSAQAFQPGLVGWLRSRRGRRRFRCDVGLQSADKDAHIGIPARVRQLNPITECQICQIR